MKTGKNISHLAPGLLPTTEKIEITTLPVVIHTKGPEDIATTVTPKGIYSSSYKNPTASRNENIAREFQRPQQQVLTRKPPTRARVYKSKNTTATQSSFQKGDKDTITTRSPAVNNFYVSTYNNGESSSAHAHETIKLNLLLIYANCIYF